MKIDYKVTKEFMRIIIMDRHIDHYMK